MNAPTTPPLKAPGDTSDIATVDMTISWKCIGSPGLGTWTASLAAGDARKEVHGRDALVAASQVPLLAVIDGLRALRRRCAVELYTDSQYLAHCAVKWLPVWRTMAERKADFRNQVRNHQLWERLHAVASGHDVQWHWAKPTPASREHTLSLAGPTKTAAAKLRSTCKTCGSEIAWTKEKDRWVTVDLDGGLHVESCSRIAEGEGLSPFEFWGRTAGEGTDVSNLYCGSLAPWDDLLGEYRAFTSAEMQEQTACYVIDAE
jgi:ribonuclease HI